MVNSRVGYNQFHIQQARMEYCFIKFLKLQKFGITKYEREKGENPSEIEKT